MRQQPNDRLKGQHAIITGASSGIGRAVAVALARDGADVVVNYHQDEEGADETLAAIAKAAPNVQAFKFQADVSKEEDVENMFATTVERFGTLDILIGNAGLQRDAPLHELSLADWQLVIDVNLTGQFLCARAAVREFKRRGTRKDVSCALGKIIFNSSVHEVIPWAGHANYAASKGALIMLMQSIAQEYGRDKIRCCNVAPGAIRTPINRSAWESPEAYEKLLKVIPYNRIGEVEDVAALFTWLASDEADYITGTTIFSDGGMTCYPGFTENG